MLGCDFIWVHASATVLESTLAYSLNSIGTKTLVVEMGVGMRITREYGDRLTEGILNLLKNLGMWSGECKPVKEPIVSADRAVAFVNSGAAGIFVPAAEHWNDNPLSELLFNEYRKTLLDNGQHRYQPYVSRL